MSKWDNIIKDLKVIQDYLDSNSQLKISLSITIEYLESIKSKEGE